MTNISGDQPKPIHIMPITSPKGASGVSPEVTPPAATMPDTIPPVNAAPKSSAAAVIGGGVMPGPEMGIMGLMPLQNELSPARDRFTEYENSSLEKRLEILCDFVKDCRADASTGEKTVEDIQSRFDEVDRMIGLLQADPETAKSLLVKLEDAKAELQLKTRSTGKPLIGKEKEELRIVTNLVHDVQSVVHEKILKDRTT